jgi:uncharacterized protein (TIGR02271 family)
MTPARVVVVTEAGDVHGSIETTSWPLDGSKPEALVQLDDGRRVFVPVAALRRQEDGRYVLSLDPAELERRQATAGEVSEPPLVVPVMVEELDVQKRRVTTGRVRISKVVREREEIVDEPLLREEVVIERVAINRFVDAVVPVRYEGDTMIVSLLEEVPVVEKRLMLKEELRITRRQVEAHKPMPVTLRSEEATVERIDINDKSPRA